LTPKWHDIEQTKKRSPSSDKDVMKGSMMALKKIYDLDVAEESFVQTQFAQFSHEQCEFGRTKALCERHHGKDLIN